MANNSRICSTCRQSYLYCPRCNEDKNKPTWYFSFCSENCMNIYGVTSKYENGQFSASEAKERLNKLDLTKIDNFGTSYKNSITKINEATSNKAKKVKEEILEEVIDTSSDVEIDETTEETVAIPETVDEEKVFKKSKKAKINVE